MRVNRINVRNFRGFEALEVDFDPDVTVLVGVNGAGKSSVLDAIAQSLLPLEQGVKNGLPFEPSLPRPKDVRRGADTASITLSAEVGGVPLTWSVRARTNGGPEFLSDDTQVLEGVVLAARRSLATEQPRLPLAVYYTTGRGSAGISGRVVTLRTDGEDHGPLSAYTGALRTGPTSFRHFFNWYREEEDVENEQIVSADRGATRSGFPSGLPAVRRAIEGLFPGASHMRMERRLQRMTLSLRGQTLDVAQLSDGEKALLALAGDLARRMVLAAPSEPDSLAEPAVVLIDEVELHLHPGLQRTIIPRLRAVFPNAQFIVSTHSPQVLSSVCSKNIRLLENFSLHELDRGTWRRDTNNILESAFGDPGRPPEVAAKLNALRTAVDEDRVDDARKLVRELHVLIEGDDPEVFFYEQMLPPEKDEAGEPA